MAPGPPGCHLEVPSPRPPEQQPPAWRSWGPLGRAVGADGRGREGTPFPNASPPAWRHELARCRGPGVRSGVSRAPAQGPARGWQFRGGGDGEGARGAERPVPPRGPPPPASRGLSLALSFTRGCSLSLGSFRLLHRLRGHVCRSLLGIAPSGTEGPGRGRGHVAQPVALGEACPALRLLWPQ